MDVVSGWLLYDVDDEADTLDGNKTSSQSSILEATKAALDEVEAWPV